MGHLLEAFLMFHSPRPRAALTFWSWCPHFCSFHCYPGDASLKRLQLLTRPPKSLLYERGEDTSPCQFHPSPWALGQHRTSSTITITIISIHKHSVGSTQGLARGTWRGRNRIQLGFAMQVTENQKMQKAGSPVSGRGL